MYSQLLVYAKWVMVCHGDDKGDRYILRILFVLLKGEKGGINTRCVGGRGVGCVCVCVRERERERERAYVCMCVPNDIIIE